MSISSEISRLSSNVSDSFAAVSSMGGTVPAGANSDSLAAAILSIPQPTIYLVERGTNNGWEYEKWSDGTAKAWISDTRTVNINEAWGSLFGCPRFRLALPTGLFAAIPIFLFSTNNTACIITPDGPGTLSNTPWIYFYRPTSLNNASVTTAILAIGNWEE